MTSSDISQSDSPAPAPIRGLDVIGIPVIGLVVGFVILVIAVAAGVLVAVSGTSATDLDAAIRGLQGNFYVIMGTIAVFYLPMVFLMWRAARRMGPDGMARFFPRTPGKTVLLGLGAGIAAFGLFYGLENVLTSWFGLNFDLGDAERSMFPTNTMQLPIAVVVVALFAPFVEEFYFRGFLLGWLRRRAGIVLALVSSAAAFAVVHGFMMLHPGASGWVITGEVFVTGLMLGGFALVTKSLWPCFALHAAYNAAVTVQMFLAST